MTDRIERERDFHNRRFSATEPEQMRNRVSIVTKVALDETYRTIGALCVGREVLEYGCGQGEGSLLVAGKYGAGAVFGIDISDVAVEQARRHAANDGITNVEFAVMNAEAMDFEDDAFDLIFGFGILHHLDLDVALRELARVVRPGGSCVFLEPMGHNPFLNLYRRLTPHLRTPDEHPLLVRDYEIFRRHFGHLETRYVNLSTLATIPVASWPGGPRLVRAAAGVDRTVLRALPFLGRYAWNVVLTFSRPRSGAR